jgi:hypothetical protein
MRTPLLAASRDYSPPQWLVNWTALPSLGILVLIAVSRARPLANAYSAVHHAPLRHLYATSTMCVGVGVVGY